MSQGVLGLEEDLAQAGGIAGWAEALEREGLAYETRRNYLQDVRAFVRWARYHGHDPLNPERATVLAFLRESGRGSRRGPRIALERWAAYCGRPCHLWEFRSP